VTDCPHLDGLCLDVPPRRRVALKCPRCQGGVFQEFGDLVCSCCGWRRVEIRAGDPTGFGAYGKRPWGLKRR